MWTTKLTLAPLQDIAGLIMFVLGFAIEAAGDQQKYLWKSSKPPRAAINDRGVWVRFFRVVLAALRNCLLTLKSNMVPPPPPNSTLPATRTSLGRSCCGGACTRCASSPPSRTLFPHRQGGRCMRPLWDQSSSPVRSLSPSNFHTFA